MNSFYCLLGLFFLFGFGRAETYTGYIVDNFCWEKEDHIAIDGADLLNKPGQHTVACMTKEEVCRESGFALLEKNSAGTYDRKFKFNDEGNKEILMQLDHTRAINNFMATVTGSVDSSTEPPTFNLASIVQTSVAGSEVSWTGFLVDNLCWEMPGHVAIDGAKLLTNPETHTVGCMLLPNCLASGFVVMGNTAISSSSEAYAPKFVLDDKGNALAASLLAETKYTNNYMVTVTGVPDNSNPPKIATSVLSEVDTDDVVGPGPAPLPDSDYAPGLTTGQTVGICIAGAFGFLIIATILGLAKAAMS